MSHSRPNQSFAGCIHPRQCDASNAANGTRHSPWAISPRPRCATPNTPGARASRNASPTAACDAAEHRQRRRDDGERQLGPFHFPIGVPRFRRCPVERPRRACRRETRGANQYLARRRLHPAGGEVGFERPFGRRHDVDDLPDAASLAGIERAQSAAGQFDGGVLDLPLGGRSPERTPRGCSDRTPRRRRAGRPTPSFPIRVRRARARAGTARRGQRASRA